MSGFSRATPAGGSMITQSDLARGAAVAREVDLTTFGRETERPSRRTIWITADALGRIHVSSGRVSQVAGLGTCLSILTIPLE